jgi:hypothetical protein
MSKLLKSHIEAFAFELLEKQGFTYYNRASIAPYTDTSIRHLRG